MVGGWGLDLEASPWAVLAWARASNMFRHRWKRATRHSMRSLYFGEPRLEIGEAVLRGVVGMSSVRYCSFGERSRSSSAKYCSSLRKSSLS